MKIKYVYHGSPKRIIGGKLLAKKPHDIENKKENTIKGVYASDLKNVAIAMAIISCKGVLYASLNTSKSKRKHGIIHEGWPNQKYIYLYTFDAKYFKRTSKGSHQWRCPVSIKPTRIEKLKVKNYLYLIKEKKMKSYYIIIRGALGIGKTTIAKKLAKVLNAKVFHMDKILEKMKLDYADKKLGCIPVENFLKGDEAIMPQIKETLDNDKVAIIDGCFYHKEQLADIEKKLEGYPGHVFTLKASLNTCIERDSKRKKVYGKGAAGAVHKLVSKIDYGKIIDIENKSVKESVDEILNIIEEWRR